jgi:aminoglycoside phosphotransferase (APT) family kinase protein
VAHLPQYRSGVIDPAILARVPGCEGARPAESIRPLPGGRGVNAVWHVRTRSGDFVLRIRHEPVDRPGSYARTELASHRLAAEAGIAPRIVDAAEDGRWMVMHHVGGAVWTDAKLLSEAGIEALGQQLRRVHALECPPSMPRIDPGAMARGYLRMIAARAPATPGGLARELESVELDARELERRSQRVVLNHGDLQTSNLLGDAPLLVDWEYAQYADPTYDIACLLTYYPALAGQRDRLLAASGLDSAEFRQILSIQQRLFARLNRLWHRAHTETG